MKRNKRLPVTNSQSEAVVVLVGDPFITNQAIRFVPPAVSWWSMERFLHTQLPGPPDSQTLTSSGG